MRREGSRTGRDDAAFARRLGRHLIALAFSLGIAACVAAPPPEPQDPQAKLDRHMLATGLGEIATYYVDNPKIETIALAGLAKLHDLDPEIAFALSSDKLELSVAGKVAETQNLDDPTAAADWAIASADLLAAARKASPKLATTDGDAIYSAIFAGYTGELDPYSRYVNPTAAKDVRAYRDGFGGIGVTIAVADGKVRIESVTHYTPAERRGLMKDDLILAIDGEPIAELTQKQVVERVRGPIDSWVKLSIARPGRAAPFDVDIQRELVVPESVTYRREGNIVYLHILGVNAETSDSVRRKIENAKAEIGEAGIAGYILDLRGNPGGLVDEVVSLANLFLDEGRIVSINGRHSDSNDYFEASAGDIAQGKPIVVLVNGESASAAEILAAALQDNGRAVLVGSNSFGKGSVQRIFTMPNAGELDLTWARFHAPSGYTLHGLGVLPSICTSTGRNAKDLLAALQAGKLPPLPITARNRTDPQDKPAIGALRATCPANTAEATADLDIARLLLADPKLYAAAADLADIPQSAISY